MSIKLLTEHHLEFLSLKGGCRGSSKYTRVTMPHCWKSHATAQSFAGLTVQMKCQALSPLTNKRDGKKNVVCCGVNGSLRVKAFWIC